MASIFGILNTGRQAIHVQQAGLAVTGNNIANINTPGYTRQRVVMEALAAGGVTLAGIERMRDGFLDARLLAGNGRLGSSSARLAALEQLESALAESDEAGVTRSLQDFFNALHELSARPDGLAEREAFLARARQLMAGMAGAAGQVEQARRHLDQQAGHLVGRANAIAAEIAKINKELGGRHEHSPATPAESQLRDKRDHLLEELATILPVRTVRDDQGMVTVFAGSVPLIEGDRVQPLRLVPDPSNQGMGVVAIADLGGRLRDMSADLAEGSLGATLRARDQDAREALAQIDRLASALAREFNALHREGTGLDGAGGRDLFAGLQANARDGFANTGDARVGSASIVDPAALTWNDYQVRFTGPDSYDVFDATSGQVVSTGNAWSAGEPILVAGMSLELAGGAPAAGDVFHLDAYGGMSGRIGLDPAVAADSRALAVGLDGAPGDNRNALAMLALRDNPVLGQPPTQGFEDFYNNFRVSLGTRVESARGRLQGEAVALEQVQAMAEMVSGVSLDEEATNLIQFQRAFEAASRIVRVSDEMMQTVLAMVR